jgi:molecular chaperone GrpE
MADPTTDAGGEGQPGPVVRDRRKIDPETGQVREAYGGGAEPAPDGPEVAPDSEAAQGSGEAGSPSGTRPGGPVAGAGVSEEAEISADQPAGTGGGEAGSGVESIPANQLAADLASARAAAEERLLDLQRLQAEYINYRRRVERDRDVARDLAIAGVMEALLPVLDDVHLARQHGDLEDGPFAAIADKLEATLVRFGLDRYGEPGQAFDPTVHEALMHTQVELAEGTTEPTVVQVLQPGYRLGERVLRAARVAVADPA